MTSEQMRKTGGAAKRSRAKLFAFVSATLACALLFGRPGFVSAERASSSEAHSGSPQANANQASRPVLEFSGTVPSRENARLHLATVLGSVSVRTHDST